MIFVVLYLAAIVAANLTVATFGPQVTILNAFLFIGLDLTTRDRLHDAWRGRQLAPKMIALIATGAALSFGLNRNAGPIALASFVAFGAAAATDTAIYHLLRKRPFWIRANGSNVPSALVDSILFPTLAFGAMLWPIILGQFAAKVLGGLLWSIVLNNGGYKWNQLNSKRATGS